MAVTYIEKGDGLHTAISLGGHWLIERDGVWIASNDAAVQAVIDTYSLEQAKAWACSKVARHAKALRDAVIADYSAAEMASWPIKLSEAAKFAVSGDPDDAPMLSTEAAARGITLAELCMKVDGRASEFATLEALISGVDGMHRDAINAIAGGPGAFEAVARYNYLTGWPV
jgi:hypothetical protein